MTQINIHRWHALPLKPTITRFVGLLKSKLAVSGGRIAYELTVLIVELEKFLEGFLEPTNVHS